MGTVETAARAAGAGTAFVQGTSATTCRGLVVSARTAWTRSPRAGGAWRGMLSISAESEFRAWAENIRLSAPALDRRRAREVQAVLRRCENDLQRELLRMRYLRALTVPEIVEALSARNLCYTQRHVERLLRRAERSASAAYRELRTGREDAHAPRQ